MKQEDKSMPKVLVGTVLSTRHIYILEEFMEKITTQDYPNYDILIVDTSSDNAAVSGWIERNYPDVKIAHSHKMPGVHPFQKMSDSRNYIIKAVKEGGYDYWFSADCDTLMPPNTISKLVANGKMICAALHDHGWLGMSFPCLSKSGSFKLGVDGFAAQWDFYNWEELKDEHGLFKSFSTSMGALLMAKEVFDILSFEYHHTFGEDIIFWLNAKARGLNVYTDLDLRVEHKNTGWDGLLFNPSLEELNDF